MSESRLSLSGVRSARQYEQMNRLGLAGESIWQLAADKRRTRFAMTTERCQSEPWLPWQESAVRAYARPSLAFPSATHHVVARVVDDTKYNGVVMLRDATRRAILNARLSPRRRRRPYSPQKGSSSPGSRTLQLRNAMREGTRENTE